MQSGGKWWAVCNCPAGEPPIEICVDDLTNFEFCVPTFAAAIHDNNGLGGSVAALSERLTFVGEVHLPSQRVAVVLALLDQGPESLALLAAIPSQLPAGYTRILVLTPTFTPHPTDAARMERIGIFMATGAVSHEFQLPTMNFQGIPALKQGEACGDDARDQSLPRHWPAPAEQTVGKVWTRKDGTMCLSTKTEGKRDGQVEFALTANGELTNQMRFMQLMCFTFPKSATLAAVMEQVYPDEFGEARQSAAALKSTLRKLRSLVSDIRTKKFAKAGLNPDILPPLNVEASIDTGIGLCLVHLHRLDDQELDKADESPE